MCAAAVVGRHHSAVVGRVDVRADAEGLPERAGQLDEEAAAGTGGGRGAGDRGLGPGVAGVPPLDGVEPPVEGQRTDATKAELERDLLLVLVVCAEEGRGEPRVVGRRLRQVAYADAAGRQ